MFVVDAKCAVACTETHIHDVKYGIMRFTSAAAALSESSDSANANVYRDTICLSFRAVCKDGTLQLAETFKGARERAATVRARVTDTDVLNIVDEDRRGTAGAAADGDNAWALAADDDREEDNGSSSTNWTLKSCRLKLLYIVTSFSCSLCKGGVKLRQMKPTESCQRTKHSCNRPAREAGDQSGAVDCRTRPWIVTRRQIPCKVNLKSH